MSSFVRGLVGAALLLALPAGASAETLLVPQDYDTINAALEAAAPCDEVVVSAGLYEEVVHVPNGVSLIADDSAGAVTLSGGGYHDVDVPMDQVVSLTGGTLLSGFHIQGAREGVTMFGNWSEVRNNTFSDVAFGARLHGGTGTFEGNTVSGADTKGFEGNNATIWIEDNVFVDCKIGVDLYQSWGRMRSNVIQGSEQAVNLGEVDFEVSSNQLEDNEVGIAISGGQVAVSGNRIESSVLGIELLAGPHYLLDNELVDNAFGIVTLFAESEFIANLIEGSTYVGVSEGIGSASRFANNRLLDNDLGFEGQISDSHFHNNLVSGGSHSMLLLSAETRVVNNVFVGATDVAVEVDEASTPLISFNLMWSNSLDFVGWTSDGTDLLADPLLDAQGWPEIGSPLIGAGSTDPQYEDNDGSLPDIGISGGPDSGAEHVLHEPSPPSQGKQQLTTVAEGWTTPIFVINVDDPHGDWVKYAWDVDASDGLDYCDSFEAAVDFTAPDEGAYMLYVRAEDSEGFVVEVEVPVEAYNEPPWIDFEIFDELFEGTDAHAWASIDDPGFVDVVEASLDTDGDGSADIVGIESGFFHWTPQQSGEWTVVLRASDDDGGVAEWAETVWIENLPPVLVNLPRRQMQVGESLDVTLLVIDPSPFDEVAIALEGEPEGMELEDFRLRWTPGREAMGTHAYDIVVTDDEGASETYFLTIAVNAAPVGCGCSSLESAPASPLLLLVLLLAASRRTQRPQPT